MPFIDGLQVTTTAALTDTVPISQGGNGVPGSATTRQITVGNLTAGAVQSAVGATVSIASLRSLSSAVTAAQVLYVEGYFTAGDNGGGVFQHISSDTTSADNGGTIIVDAAGRRWYRATSDGCGVSIKFFGAKCDGVTNDTTAFAAAVAVCPWVAMPSGTILISPNVLTIALEGQRLSGSCGLYNSAEATVLLVQGSGGPGIKINVQFCQMENFCISRSGTAVLGDDGISQIHNIGSENYLLRNIFVTAQWVGFDLGSGAFSECQYCVAQQNLNHGFSINNKGVNGAATVQFLDCLSQTNGGIGFNNAAIAVAGVAQMFGVGSNYINCTSFRNAGGGFVFTGAMSGSTVKASLSDVWLSGCISSFDGGTTQSGFVFFQTSGFNIRLDSCFCEGAGSNGFQCDATTVDIQISNCKASGVRNNGFNLGATRIVAVSNCNADQNGAAGLSGAFAGLVHQSGNMTLTGGCFTDGGTGTQSFGINSFNGANFTGCGFNCQGNVTTNLVFQANAGSAQIAASRS